VRRKALSIDHARIWFGVALIVLCTGVGLPSLAEESIGPPAAPIAKQESVLDAMVKSLTGDVYAEPSTWRELSLGTVFSEGWREPWVSAPRGGGGAPRQGVLNAFDGVFLRLGIVTYGYANNFLENGSQNTGSLELYLPFNRRFEIRTAIPMVVSNRGATGTTSMSNFGDDVITPRVILSETQNVTQSLNVAFRTPTGNTFNKNGVAAVTPTYEFWSNWWQGLVVRGGVGFFLPYGHQSITKVGARTAFTANVAPGYYFTPHDFTPFGDLVWYVSTNLVHLIDDRGPKTTSVSLTPGVRSHLGQNWFLLSAVEVPVTKPEPFDYQVQVGLMKVF
jgi:hypothetical protein